MLGFWRIILDEAQIVSNSNSAAALMASALWRRHAWLVTGTPVNAKLSELQGLLAFLDVRPFADPQAFNALVHTAYERRASPPHSYACALSSRRTCYAGQSLTLLSPSSCSYLRSSGSPSACPRGGRTSGVRRGDIRPARLVRDLLPQPPAPPPLPTHRVLTFDSSPTFHSGSHS